MKPLCIIVFEETEERLLHFYGITFFVFVFFFYFTRFHAWQGLSEHTSTYLEFIYKCNNFVEKKKNAAIHPLLTDVKLWEAVSRCFMLHLHSSIAEKNTLQWLVIVLACKLYWNWNADFFFSHPTISHPKKNKTLTVELGNVTFLVLLLSHL